MLSIVVTSWKDPVSTRECITRLMAEDLPKEFEVLITAPDRQTLLLASEFNKKYPKKFTVFEQPESMGKNELINAVRPSLKGDIVLFIDGNKFVKKGSLASLLFVFDDASVGCAGGRPVSRSDRNTLFGYWSHLLLDVGAHGVRSGSKAGYVWLSANLLAVRRSLLGDIPLDVAEDAIIPYFILKKR